MSEQPAPRFFYAGLERFDMARSKEDHRLDPVLPEALGRVHAALFRTRTGARLREAHFQTPPSTGHGTMCARLVRVILPREFDPADPDACHKCAAAVKSERERMRSATG